jgi:predicted NAD-dependent protein-ADP-ribosyltransferase YbiA (DUF1768 family)
MENSDNESVSSGSQSSDREEEEDFLYFYGSDGKYGRFSNRSPIGFELEGKKYKSMEHWFQSKKFEGTLLL